MKTFALEIFACLVVGILGLQAATTITAPSVRVSQIILLDDSGGQWWIIGNGTVYDLRHISITGKDKKGNLTRVNLDQMGNATLPQILIYLKKQGVTFEQ